MCIRDRAKVGVTRVFSRPWPVAALGNHPYPSRPNYHRVVKPSGRGRQAARPCMVEEGHAGKHGASERAAPSGPGQSPRMIVGCALPLITGGSTPSENPTLAYAALRLSLIHI